MMDKYKKILLLDDDERFCRRMKSSLERVGSLKVNIPLNLSTDSVKKVITQHPPDYVLLDVNLGDYGAKELLKGICKSLSEQCRVWMVSGVTGTDKIDLVEYRKITELVQSVLAKPFFLQDLLAEFKRVESTKKKHRRFRLKDKEANNLPIPDRYQYINLPVRILDGEMRVIYKNPAWTGPLNRPGVQDFSWTSEQIPSPKRYWGSLIPGTGAVNYKIHSFLIPEHDRQGPWLGQVVEHGYESMRSSSLEDTVERVFRVMHSQGFPRGRFYRWIEISGCDGLLSLEQVTNHPDLALPIKHPLFGELARRLEEYVKNDKPEKQDPLCFTIRKRDEEAKLNDEGIAFWNDFLSVDKLDSWVEVPVLQKCRKRGYRPAGLFIFDRIGIDEEALGEVLFDGEPGTVTEAEMANAGPTLRQVLCGVVDAFKAEKIKLRLEWYKSLASLDDALEKIQPDKEDEVEHALLRTARKLTGAQGGVLIIRQGQANFLTIRAVSGYVPDCLLSATLDLEAVYHPIVKCWNDKEPVFVPDYQHSDDRAQVVRNADYTHLCPNHRVTLKSWFEKEIGTLMAIPITVGEEVIGAISLQYEQAFACKRSDYRVMELLVQRARWSLSMLNRSRFQRDWELTFAHEIRSDLIVAAEALSEAIQFDTDDEKSALKTAMGQTTAVLDLSQNFMNLQNPNPDLDRLEHFEGPYTCITDYLDTNKLKIDVDEQRVEVTPPLADSIWKTSLIGSENIFSRVLRNLMSNALKFGESGAEITLSARIKDGHFQLSLENPGQMTDEELRNRYEPGVRSGLQRKRGAHVGLSASRQWAVAYGAKLEVNNIPDSKRVRADLYWPLSNKERQNERG